MAKRKTPHSTPPPSGASGPELRDKKPTPPNPFRADNLFRPTPIQRMTQMEIAGEPPPPHVAPDPTEQMRKRALALLWDDAVERARSEPEQERLRRKREQKRDRQIEKLKERIDAVLTLVEVKIGDSEELSELKAKVRVAAKKKSEGGKKGAKTRQAKMEAWMDHADELADTILTETPDLSDDAVASEIEARWKLDKPKSPRHRRLQTFMANRTPK
jgi:hypothetical protein